MSMPTKLDLSVGSAGIYLSNRPTADHLEVARSQPFGVVKGQGGVAQVPKLREQGIEIPLLLDPATYEPKVQATVAPEKWIELQLASGSPGLISPGELLDWPSIGDRWAQQIGDQLGWCELAGSTSYCSLAVTTDVLVKGADRLANLIEDVGYPIWLTLAGRNDPLEKLGAVDGLVHILQSHERIALMRSDLAAIGALAFGAELGSVGASGTVRHVGLGGGGSRLTNRPSILVRSLLTWRKDTILLSWLQRDSDVEQHLRCNEDCCQGALITDSLVDPAVPTGAIVHHNFTTIQSLRADVVGSSDPPAKWRSVAGNARFLNEWMESAIPGTRAPRHLRQWCSAGI